MDPVNELYDVVNGKGNSDLSGVTLSNVQLTASGSTEYGYEISGEVSRKSINGSSYQFHQSRGGLLDLSVFIPSVAVSDFQEDVVFAQNLLQQAAGSVSLHPGLIRFTLGFVTLYWNCLVDRGDAVEYDVSN